MEKERGKRKISPKSKFWAAYPCEHPVEKFGQDLQILENHDAILARTSRSGVHERIRSENFGLIYIPQGEENEEQQKKNTGKKDKMDNALERASRAILMAF